MFGSILVVTDLLETNDANMSQIIRSDCSSLKSAPLVSSCIVLPSPHLYAAKRIVWHLRAGGIQLAGQCLNREFRLRAMAGLECYLIGRRKAGVLANRGPSPYRRSNPPQTPWSRADEPVEHP